MGMHQTVVSFARAERQMKSLVQGVVEAAYQLGDPSRSGMALFDAREYEASYDEQLVLVEVRYGMGRVMGRGRTHYSCSPVFSEEFGWAEMRKRIETMLAVTGYPMTRLDIVHVTESDCWALLVGVRA